MHVNVSLQAHACNRNAHANEGVNFHLINPIDIFVSMGFIKISNVYLIKINYLFHSDKKYFFFFIFNILHTQ